MSSTIAFSGTFSLRGALGGTRGGGIRITRLSAGGFVISADATRGAGSGFFPAVAVTPYMLTLMNISYTSGCITLRELPIFLKYMGPLHNMGVGGWKFI